MSLPPVDLNPATWKPTPPPHHDTIPAGFHVPYEVKDCEYGKVSG